MPVVYVLALEGGRFYVGKTNRNMYVRFLEHQSGNGCAWTSLYKPLRLVERVDCASSLLAGLEEEHRTKRLMLKHGIDMVRGGPFCAPTLTLAQREELQRSLRHANDECYQCGAAGHFAGDCTAQPATAHSTRRRPPRRMGVDDLLYACVAACCRSWFWPATEADRERYVDGRPVGSGGPSLAAGKDDVVGEARTGDGNAVEAGGNDDDALFAAMADCSACGGNGHVSAACSAAASRGGGVPASSVLLREAPPPSPEKSGAATHASRSPLPLPPGDPAVGGRVKIRTRGQSRRARGGGGEASDLAAAASTR